MAKVKSPSSSSSSRKMRPALSVEARENQLAALAFDLVEQRLRDGTASSQETTHFLKIANTRYKSELENQILERQKDLITAKTESLQSQKRTEELIGDALAAMKRYAGYGGSEDDYQDIY